MLELEMEQIARWLMAALRAHKQEPALAAIRSQVEELCGKFPVPGIPVR